MGVFDNFVYKDGEIVDNSVTKQNIKLVTGWMIHPLGKITCNTPLGG